VDDPAQLLLRFAHYFVLLGLFGMTAFRATGLRAIGLSGAPPRIVGIFAITAPALSAALFLVSIAAMMGKPVIDVEWSVIEAMLVTTDMGWAFLIRCLLLMLAIIPILRGARWRYGTAIAAFLYACALLTLPWSGHAAATEGGLGHLHRFNDALHLLASGYWFGAIGWLTLLAVRAHRGNGMLRAAQLLGAMHRFRAVGLATVAVVALTGTLNAHLIFGIGNSAAMLGTLYGQLLAAKIMLVAIMIAFASHHAGLARQQDIDDGQVLARIRRSLAAELAIAIVVVGAVAALGMVSPMLNPQIVITP
jgi:copper resistance protein D